MSEFSDAYENSVLDHVLGTAALTSPSSVTVALYTDDPGDDNSGTEVSGGAYARQTVTFASASGGSASSDVEVLFPVATAAWGNITHFALFDNGGTMIMHSPLDNARDIQTGDQFKLSSGNITATLS